MNSLNLGQVLVLISKIISILQREGIIDAQGNFVNNLDAEVRVFLAIEAELKADGLVVPDKVDKIVQIIPLVLSMVK